MQTTTEYPKVTLHRCESCGNVGLPGYHTHPMRALTAEEQERYVHMGHAAFDAPSEWPADRAWPPR